jgi:hypothetical protein
MESEMHNLTLMFPLMLLNFLDFDLASQKNRQTIKKRFKKRKSSPSDALPGEDYSGITPAPLMNKNKFFTRPPYAVPDDPGVQDEEEQTEQEDREDQIPATTTTTTTTKRPKTRRRKGKIPRGKTNNRGEKQPKSVPKDNHNNIPKDKNDCPKTLTEISPKVEHEVEGAQLTHVLPTDNDRSTPPSLSTTISLITESPTFHNEESTTVTPSPSKTMMGYSEKQEVSSPIPVTVKCEENTKTTKEVSVTTTATTRLSETRSEESVTTTSSKTSSSEAGATESTRDQSDAVKVKENIFKGQLSHINSTTDTFVEDLLDKDPEESVKPDDSSIFLA